MKREKLNSRMLRSAGYDPATQTLELEFEAGTLYQYKNVPEFTFRALLKANSKGAYFNQAIDQRFPCVQIR